MTLEKLKELLDSANDKDITSRMLRDTPWIFQGNQGEFARWRADIADIAVCNTVGIYVVGSSAIGYSLSPTKPGRPFRHVSTKYEQPSDIDVAIVSDVLFREAWDALRLTEIERSIAASRDDRDKIRTDVYWGFVAGASVPTGTSPSRILRNAMSKTTYRSPFRGHRAQVRIYRRDED